MSLTFVAEPGIYDRNRMLVRITAHDGQHELTCTIFQEVLEYMAEEGELTEQQVLGVFEANRPGLQECWRRKYGRDGADRTDQVQLSPADL